MEEFSSVQWPFEVVLTAIASQGTPWNSNKKVVWETFWKEWSNMVVGITKRRWFYIWSHLHLEIEIHFTLYILSFKTSLLIVASVDYLIHGYLSFRYLSSNPLKIRHELNATKTVKKKKDKTQCSCLGLATVTKHPLSQQIFLAKYAY